MPTPPSTGAVTPRGAFGWRTHPITGKWTLHNGEDRVGAGNFAPVSGHIIFAGWDSSGAGFGNAVAIKQDGAKVVWWIAHFSSIDVSVGQWVVEGQKIGTIGMTGAATGIHTHTERRENGNASPRSGIATDPGMFYGSTSGGGTTPITPTRKKKSMSTLYILTGSSPALWALAGDGVGDAAWLEIGDQALANNLAAVHGSSVPLSQGTWNLWKSAYRSGVASGGLTSAQNAALMGLPNAVADLPTNGELEQALTSTVVLVNGHADDNRDAIIAAIPGGGSSASYELSLTIDEIPGTATGTATPN